jgi:hypothetical protein
VILLERGGAAKTGFFNSVDRLCNAVFHLPFNALAVHVSGAIYDHSCLTAKYLLIAITTPVPTRAVRCQIVISVLRRARSCYSGRQHRLV